MRSIVLTIAVATLIAGMVAYALDRDDALAQTAATGCASLTAEDWDKRYLDFHIDEYDPNITTPVNYVEIDETRLLVWFAGLHHGRPGYTECEEPEPEAPEAVAAATMEAIPTATPTPAPVLIGCRWPGGEKHTFSSPASPDYDECIEKGGTLEYQD